LFHGRKSKGISTLEIIVALSLLLGVIFALIYFIRDCFYIWRETSYKIEIERIALVALEEMARYIRGSEVESILPKPGDKLNFVSFRYRKKNGEFENLKYYKENDRLLCKDNSGVRVVVPYGVKTIYFFRVRRNLLRIEDFVVSKGDKSISLSRSIFLRE